MKNVAQRFLFGRRQAAVAMVATLIAVVALTMAGCSHETTDPTAGLDDQAFTAGGDKTPPRGRFIVANRGSGTISVIDAGSKEVLDTLELPAAADEPTPEPMYVVHTHNHNRVFVGDRANDRVAVFDAATMTVEGTVPAGQGVFHMWADPQGKQLWVNNDIDNTTTVIDPAHSAGPHHRADPGRPGGPGRQAPRRHPRAQAATSPTSASWACPETTTTWSSSAPRPSPRPVGRPWARIPTSPWRARTRYLYVPCQNSNTVVVLDRQTLATVTDPGCSRRPRRGHGPQRQVLLHHQPAGRREPAAF